MPCSRDLLCVARRVLADRARRRHLRTGHAAGATRAFAVKWRTLQDPEGEYKGRLSAGEHATVEALRAIAEQLERVATAFEYSRNQFSRAIDELDAEIKAEQAQQERDKAELKPPEN